MQSPHMDAVASPSAASFQIARLHNRGTARGLLLRLLQTGRLIEVRHSVSSLVKAPLDHLAQDFCFAVDEVIVEPFPKPLGPALPLPPPHVAKH